MTKFSIICPVYAMKDNLGQKFLIEYLAHLQFQTLKDFEVIVTDQSEDNRYDEICKVFSNCLNIKHYKNTVRKTAACNVNYGIKKATGSIIKLLYVDDFFVVPNALEIIYNSYSNSNNKWGISGFIECDQDKNTFFNKRLPWFGNKYPNGDNTTGNPSTYFVLREYALEMDENMLWLVDGEYFYRSYYHHGDPICINEILVCFRKHEQSAFLDEKFKNLHEKELLYVFEKYKNLPKSIYDV